MKYQNWNEYPASKKWRAVAEEMKLDTHNGTTKADLLNMVKFLARKAVTLQARVYDLEGVNDETGMSGLQKTSRDQKNENL